MHVSYQFLERSGAGFWVQMVSRVSFQGLYDRVSLQGLLGVRIFHVTRHSMNGCIKIVALLMMHNQF